jgi:hypothetical protein
MSTLNASPASTWLSISNVQHGRFELLSQVGQDITSFTQQQVNLNQVRFVHDSSCFAPSYQISSSAIGLASTPAVAANINFIPTHPIISMNNFSFSQGQTLTLSPNNLNTTDPGDVPSNLVYTISNVQHGNFAPSGFTQQDINSGTVHSLRAMDGE